MPAKRLTIHQATMHQVRTYLFIVFAAGALAIMAAAQEVLTPAKRMPCSGAVGRQHNSLAPLSAHIAGQRGAVPALVQQEHVNLSPWHPLVQRVHCVQAPVIQQEHTQKHDALMKKMSHHAAVAQATGYGSADKPDTESLLACVHCGVCCWLALQVHPRTGV